VTPTQSATVLVAFAAMGATPVNIRAGKAMKLPPPATALSAPPSAPAKKRKIRVWSAKYQVVSQDEWRRTGSASSEDGEVAVAHNFGIPP